MIENCLISGVATALAMVSGEAPGSWARDRHRREVDLRQRRHRQLEVGEQSRQRDRHRQQDGRDGPADEQRRRVHERGLDPGSGGLGSRRSPARARRRACRPAAAAVPRLRPGRPPARPSLTTTWSPMVSPTRHLAYRGLVVGADHVDERPVLARLDRHQRYRHRVRRSGRARLRRRHTAPATARRLVGQQVPWR